MTVTPTPAQPSLALGEDTGLSNSDGIIDISMPTLIGQTLPNAVVTIYANDFDTIVGTGIADAKGNYDVVLSQALGDGKNVLTATATAPGQSVSMHSSPLRITVDTSPPDLPTAPVLSAADDTGMSALDGITNKTVLHLTGHSEPGATVSLLVGTIVGDGTPGPRLVLATATVAADGSYTLVTPKLADATYTFSVVATDVAGNTSTETADNLAPTTTIIVDTKAPAAPPAPTLSPGSDTGVLHTDGLTSNTTPTVIGTTEANATVQVFDGSQMVGKATADATGNYAVTTSTLDYGSHTLTAKAIDAAGNVSAASAPLAVFVDTQAPTATSDPVPDDAIFGSVPFELHFSEAVTGLTTASLQVLVTGTANGEIAQITGSGSDYVVVVDGLSGAGTLQLGFAPDSQVTDGAGNAATLSVSNAYSYDDQNETFNALVATYPFQGSTGDIGLSEGGRLVSYDTGVTYETYTPTSEVYVRDMRTGGVTRISGGVDGTIQSGVSGASSLSANGTAISFVSTASGLIAGGPTDGLPNLYVAHLSTSNVAQGQAVRVTSIRLVSTGNGTDGLYTPSHIFALDGLDNYGVPQISGDGTHIVFATAQPLISGVAPAISNIYEENLTTGALSLITAATNTDNADHPSVSADGSKVVYETFTGSNQFAGYPDSLGEGIFVYDAASKTTIRLDSAVDAELGLYGQGLGITSFAPQINALGTWVTYSIQVGNNTAFIVNQNIETSGVNAGKIELLTPDEPFNYNDDSTVSLGGRYVSYALNSLDTNQNVPSGQVGLVDSLTDNNIDIGPGVDPVLSPDGNAIAYNNILYTQDDGTTTLTGGQILLTTLGPTVGIDPVGGNEALDADQWQDALASGLVVTGVTDAPAGSTVRLQLLDTSSGAVLSTAQTTVAGDTSWSATLPAPSLQAITDGSYRLKAIASTTSGASFPSNQTFTIDTMAPDTPDAPKLDAGSDGSLASDGSATNSDTPVLTGTTEASARVTLYDLAGPDPTAVLGTTIADANGVYAVSLDAPLINLTYKFAVTATDLAGNVSALSDPDTVIVDTVAPDTPRAPTLSPTILPASAGNPPSDTGASDTDGITSNATPTFTGTAEAKSTVTLYDTDDINVLGTTTAAANGTWSIKPDNGLSDGTHSITVTATDAAGNVSARSPVETVVIDTLPPLMPVITNVSGPTPDGTDYGPLISVTGTAEPGSTVAIRIDNDNIDLGQSTADASGNYTVESDALPAGAHTLAIIATDVAGNASQPSLGVPITISANPVPPPGTPPGLLPILALETDGPIAGATVFADANGNGIQDPGEASAATQNDGVAALYAPSGELVATGGIDISTDLTPPGALTAPSGSTVITPLTTLLDAYARVLGADAASVQGQLAIALGLQTTGNTDLMALDPGAAALSQSAALDPAVAGGSAEIVSAKLMDIAVDFTAAIVGSGQAQPQAVIFADVFNAIAQTAAALPPGGTLDLDSISAMDSLMTMTLADLGTPQTVLGYGVSAAAEIASGGNRQIDTARAYSGVSFLAAVTQVETVEQGSAATTLTAAGNDRTLAADAVQQYTGPLLAQASATALDLVEAAPQLAPGSDTGLSDRDDVIDINTPTFTGTANPGTYVTLMLEVGSFPPYSGLVIGNAVADSTGHYSIVSAPLDQPSQINIAGQEGTILAVGSAADPGYALGAKIPLPTTFNSTNVLFDLPASSSLLFPPAIAHATLAASAGDSATQTALFLQLSVSEFANGEIQVFADGGTTPVGSYVSPGGDQVVGLLTAPLSVGTHTLTITETEIGGTVLSGAPPYTVTVTPIGLFAATGLVLGGLSDATVDDAHTNTGSSASLAAIDGTTTGADGTFLAQLTTTHTPALMLVGGYDSVTGEPLGGHAARAQLGVYAPNVLVDRMPNLLAPYNSRTINPLTTIQELLDVDDYNPGGGDAQDNSDNAMATLAAFGLPVTEDLSTLDPLAQAEAGNPAALIVTIKLIDTMTMMSPFFGSFNAPSFDFGPIAEYLDNEDTTINLDSATDIAAALAAYYPNPGNDQLPRDQYKALAAIIAASNQAIDNHATSSNSIADTVSYAVAASTLAQENETALLQQSATEVLAGSADPFSAVNTAYSGAALDDAILSERAQLVQATAFVATGSETTSASGVIFTIDFSRPVTGLSTANFTPLTGGDLAGVSVTGVTAVVGSNDTSYTVSVGTGIGQGSLALAFSGNGLTGFNGTAVTAGLFAPPTLYSTLEGGRSTGLAVGDFNGDGRPDVIINDGYYSTLFVNEADGFVAAPALSFDGREAGSIAVGDFNGDGKLDFISMDLAEAGSSVMLVRLGDGTGQFGLPIETIVPGASAMAVGDFNEDGRADVAVAGYSTNAVTILLGNGDGTFRAAQSLATGHDPNAIATAALTRDGHLDLVTTNGDDGTVSVFLGAGDGTFAASGTAFAAGSEPDGLAIGDLNGDGIADIAVADESGAVTILLGKGDGTFTTLAPMQLTSAELPEFQASSIAIGDVNNDGKPDLVVGGFVQGTVVLLGNGDGTFQPGEQDASDGSTIYAPSLALADVNGDGRLDILSSGQGTDQFDNSSFGLEVEQNIGEPVLGATSAAVTISRAAVAQPVLTEAKGSGTLSHVGNAYTLDLGTVSASGTLVFSLANVATGDADSFDGQFSDQTGSGFTISGAMLPAALAAGQSYTGLTFTVDASVSGAHSETITFSPRDTASTVTPDTAPDGPDGETSANAPAASNVGLELAPITLTVTDTVMAGGGPVAPTITGTIAGQTVSDVTTLHPFATVVIADQNAAQTEAVDITANAANGALTDPSAATDGSEIDGSTYTVSGSAASVSAALAGLVFTPTPHQVAPGRAVTTSFGITVTDTAGASATDGTSSVIATASETPPVIGGTVAGQTLTTPQTLLPFAQATLADPDAGAMVTTTITLRAAGVASDADGSLTGAGLTRTATGTYVLAAATPDAAQSALRAVVFNPLASTAGSSVTTVFDVQVSDGTTTADDVTTSVITTTPAGGTPVPPSITLALDNDTGISSSDAITSVDDLMGSAPSHDVITFSEGDTVLGTARVNEGGYYFFTPSGLADGSHTVTAIDTDAGGTASVSVNFTLDTQAPQVDAPGLSVAGNSAAQAIGIEASDTLTATADLSATITALPDDGTVTLSGAALQNGQVLNGTQLAQLDFTPLAGVSNTSGTLGFTVTDLTGNTTAASTTLSVGALVGGGNGDVHIVNFEGLHYDFQNIGDFLLAEDKAGGGTNGFAVQMRATPFDQTPGTSIATELGARVGQDIVQFGVNSTPVTVNGQALPDFGVGGRVVQLASGTLTQTDTNDWSLQWTTGEVLNVVDAGYNLNFSIVEGPQDTPGTLQGVLASGPAQGDTWAVPPGSSLLDLPTGAPSLSGLSFLAPEIITSANRPDAIWTGSLGRVGTPVELQGRGATLSSGWLTALAPGDLIDLMDFRGATGSASYAAGIIQVNDGSHSASLHLTTDTPTLLVTTSADQHGGLLLHIGSGT